MKSWLIIGAGVSGFGAAQLLRKQGDKVRVTERTTLPIEKKSKWLSLGVDVRDGFHDLSHLDGITHVVLSPGVTEKHLLFQGARDLGLPIISEIDLALKDYKGHLIGVTGTNGKSTTCAMVFHLLKKLGLDAGIGGNFGDPPSAILARGSLPNYLVLELSSYQLEQTHGIHPEVSIFTSFSHDHIARHGSLEAYLKVKWKIFEKQNPKDLALLTSDIHRLGGQMDLSIPARHEQVTPSLIAKFLPEDCGPKEVHNKLNAILSVLAVAHVTGERPEALLPLLDDFMGLPHRCELVGMIGGLPVTNDSKSTNVESTLVALESQKTPVILMMGGQGKEEPYSPILSKKSIIAALVTFGPTGKEIAHQLGGSFPIFPFPTLIAALEAISGILEKHKHPILFSPGCASFDEFANYEHRGEVFRKAMIPLCDSSPLRDPSS